MKHLHEKFATYLKTQEGRYTAQKKAIVTQVFKQKAPFEIESFIESVRKKDKLFSRATVYRTIKQLLEAGILKKIPNKDGRLYYELVQDNQHYAHIICNGCGQIAHFLEDHLENYIQNYCKTVRFQAAYQSIHIYGQCESCNCQKPYSGTILHP